ncbi:MAG TPA: SPW repeat protein [Hyphomicrobiaceae bacterium]|jgi:hypothetical protein
MTQTRGNIVLSNRWQDWVNLVLGAWLFISPWVLGFASAAREAGTTTPRPAVNAWIFGVIVVVLSIAALVRTQPWEEWLNLLAGIWLFISPWVLGYSGTATPLWNALIVGALVFILACWDLNTLPEASRRQA